MATNIHVSDEVWRELNSRKRRGESFNDVLERELGLGGDEDGGDDERGEREEQRAGEQDDSRVERDDIKQALSGWSHGRGEREQRASRAVAVEATAWLREYGERARRRDVPLERFADGDELGRSADTIWTEVIRPAWQWLDERGELVERPDSRNYVFRR